MTTSRGSKDGEQGMTPVQVRAPVLTVRGIDACHAVTMEAARGSARYDIPVVAKLSADVTDIVTIARHGALLSGTAADIPAQAR